MILILDTTTTQNPGNTRAWRLCGKVEWSQFEASDFLSSISQRKRSLWSAIVQHTHTHNNMRVLQILDTIFDVAVDAIFLLNQISFWVYRALTKCFTMLPDWRVFKKSYYVYIAYRKDLCHFIYIYIYILCMDYPYMFK